jgi:hypothetical protein
MTKSGSGRGAVPLTRRLGISANAWRLRDPSALPVLLGSHVCPDGSGSPADGPQLPFGASGVGSRRLFTELSRLDVRRDACRIGRQSVGMTGIVRQPLWESQPTRVGRVVEGCAPCRRRSDTAATHARCDRCSARSGAGHQAASLAAADIFGGDRHTNGWNLA